jgi:hypothetical protein
MCIPIQLSVYGDHMLLRTQNGTNFSMGTNIPYSGSTAPSLTPDKRNLFLVNKYSVAAYQGYPIGFMVLYLHNGLHTLNQFSKKHNNIFTASAYVEAPYLYPFGDFVYVPAINVFPNVKS